MVGWLNVVTNAHPPKKKLMKIIQSSSVSKSHNPYSFLPKKSHSRKVPPQSKKRPSVTTFQRVYIFGLCISYTQCTSQILRCALYRYYIHRWCRAAYAEFQVRQSAGERLAFEYNGGCGCLFKGTYTDSVH